MMSDQNLRVRISAEVGSYLSGMRSAAAGTRGFSSSVGTELTRVKGMFHSVQGVLGTLGLTVGGIKLAVDTAQFEQDMRRLQVNLGASREEMESWRKEAYGNQKNYGASVADQKELAESLQAAGLNMQAIRAGSEAVSKALIVSKTNADQLGKAMGVAQEQFNIDLANPKSAEDLLNKMVVAGRLGNAELENLPDIFARVGGNAKAANFSLEQTLALTEVLSKAEPQSERLGTLVDSTLRMFTNDKYMKDAQKATGVDFFGKDGMRRDPGEVFRDMRTEYAKLKTEAQQADFVSGALGKADADTIKGMRKILSEGTLDSFTQMLSDIQNSAGTIDRDLGTAMDNAVVQASRLKGAFKEAVEDGMMRPLNDIFTTTVGFVMDKKEDGGLGMDGKDMFKMGGSTFAAAALGGMALRIARGGGMRGGLMGTAGNVAVGQALESAAGVQSVFVVNMPSGLLGGARPAALPGVAGPVGGLGGAATGASGSISKLGLAADAAVMGIASFGAGWSAGTAIREAYLKTETGNRFEDVGGELITRWLAYAGSDDAKQALKDNDESLPKLATKIMAMFGNEQAKKNLDLLNQRRDERLANGTAGSNDVAKMALTSALAIGKGSMELARKREYSQAYMKPVEPKQVNGQTALPNQSVKPTTQNPEFNRVMTLLGNQSTKNVAEISQKMQAESQRNQAILDGTGQQAAQAVKSAGDAAATTIKNSKIEGNISVSITAPAGFGVQATASGNGNTKLNLGGTGMGGA